jgi:hypothetical protein
MELYRPSSAELHKEGYLPKFFAEDSRKVNYAISIRFIHV